MNKSSNRVSVIVDIAAEANNLNKVIEESKKSLNKLSPGLSDAQIKQFISQFDKLQQKIATSKINFASGLGNPSDFARAEKAINGFYQQYRDVINKINSINCNLLRQVFLLRQYIFIQHKENLELYYIK